MQMMSPGMPVTAESLKQDPLLLFPRYAMQLATPSQQDIEMEQGFATIHHEQGISRLFVLQLTQSPYNIDYQNRPLLGLNKLSKTSGNGIKISLDWNYFIFKFWYAIGQTGNLNHWCWLDTGLNFLVWFGFRSLRPLATEFIAVSTGSFVAFAVTHWVFGEIHLMTLVFGASLIGVCVDFSFYFMAMQSQHKLGGFQILKPLLPSLFMGLMTTLVAYIF